MEDTPKRFIDAFEKHSDELFRHCALRISDRDRALDLVQDTFLRAWQHLTDGGEVRQYRAFLYKILNNLIVDEYRKKKIQSLDALLENEETENAIEGGLLRDSVDALEEAMIRFDSKRAMEALSELPEHYRSVLVLRYVDGLSPSEIAECIDDSENTVSVRIHRALHKLRSILESHEQH